jgi:hypothetical protein
MATPKTTTKKTDMTTSRIASRPQAERRVDAVQTAPRGTKPSFQDVSRRAFEIWERNGRLPGTDLQNWLQAEAELRGA